MKLCNICPRKCNIDRSVKTGFCGVSSNPVISGAFLHMWEEPCISGTKGSGTVFFCGCNLKCVFCQNYTISFENNGEDITIDELAAKFLDLQAQGAHNINLVTPGHYILQVKEALVKAEGLKIPILYNTNAYDSLNGLRLLDGLVDVYLPDIKYVTPEISLKYSGAADYFKVASEAVLEMYRQVGAPIFDEDGMITRGLIIRHLILPGQTGESIKVLDWIKKNLPGKVYISLMSQYTPCHKASLLPEINRRITRREYDKVVNHFFKLGLDNGYVQERDSASEEYIPETIRKKGKSDQFE